MATSTTDFDAIVIGGGPAGLAEPVTGVCASPVGARVSFSEGPDEQVAAAGGVAAAAMVQQLL